MLYKYWQVLLPIQIDVLSRDMKSALSYGIMCYAYQYQSFQESLIRSRNWTPTRHTGTKNRWFLCQHAITFLD